MSGTEIPIWEPGQGPESPGPAGAHQGRPRAGAGGEAAHGTEPWGPGTLGPSEVAGKREPAAETEGGRPEGWEGPQERRCGATSWNPNEPHAHTHACAHTRGGGGLGGGSDGPRWGLLTAPRGREAPAGSLRLATSSWTPAQERCGCGGAGVGGSEGMGNSGTASPGRPLSGGAALWPWRGGSQVLQREGLWGGGEAGLGGVPGEGLRLLPHAQGPQGGRGALRRQGGRSSSWGGGLCPEGTGPSSPAPLPGGTLHPQVLTALDRDASCRKHKLRQKLEQIISLVSSNS